jgi:hypothetical protein
MMLRVKTILLFTALLVSAIVPTVLAADGAVSCGRARIKHMDELCFPGAEMTVEAWIFPEENRAWGRIVSKYGHTINNKPANHLRGWEIAINDNGRLFFRVMPYSENMALPAANVVSTAVIPVGQWTHIACVLNGPAGKLQIYVNGKLDAESSDRALGRVQINPQQDLYLGSYGGEDKLYFKGLVDELRLTADALVFTGIPVSPYTGKEAKTVALYHFDSQEPGGKHLNSVNRDKHQLLLIDGAQPSLADSRSGFGKALRLTAGAPAGVAFNSKYPFKPIPYPSVEEIGRIGQKWQASYPNRIKAELLGKGSSDLPLHMLTITDFKVSDGNKEVVLMLAMHSGAEVSGTTSLLAFAEWLLGDDPLAAKIRSRQICIILPVPNPYGYGKTGNNKFGRDIAWCWTPAGASLPEENPEGVLVQKLIDRLKPEVIVDSHGTMLQGAYMGEFVGTSGYSLVLNTFQGSVVREMSEAAEVLGFPQHLGSETHEKIMLPPETMQGYENRFYVYPTASAVNACTYAYIKYHSIPLTIESGGWSGSAVARLKRLLEIGCDRFGTELCAGYPNRRISVNSSWMQWLTAYGQTAAERRESRVELWNKQSMFRTFRSYPDMDGAFCFGIAMSPDAAKKVFLGCRQGDNQIYVSQLLSNLSRLPGVDVEAIKKHLEETGSISKVFADPDREVLNNPGPVAHGLAIRSMLPYNTPRILEVRLNGKLINPSERDGYQVWKGGLGGTYIQVNIPPEKMEEVIIVTCKYDGQEKREWGFTAK